MIKRAQSPTLLDWYYADTCFTVALGSVLAGCYTQVPHRSTLYQHHRTDQRKKLFKENHLFLLPLNWYLSWTLARSLSRRDFNSGEYSRHELINLQHMKTKEIFTTQVWCLQSPKNPENQYYGLPNPRSTQRKKINFDSPNSKKYIIFLLNRSCMSS